MFGTVVVSGPCGEGAFDVSFDERGGDDAGSRGGAAELSVVGVLIRAARSSLWVPYLCMLHLSVVCRVYCHVESHVQPLGAL